MADTVQVTHFRRANTYRVDLRDGGSVAALIATGITDKSSAVQRAGSAAHIFGAPIVCEEVD